ncbi:MAG: hypothetical protein HYU66_23075 [Armatimonadetes bacterium]|nr:hypothetical protein [Armatimonadota bacterium]
MSADPDNVFLRQELLRQHARCLEALDEPDDRLEWCFTLNLEVLCALNPRDPSAAEVLAGQVDPGYEPSPPDDPEAGAAWRLALEAIERGRSQEAEKPLRAALLAAPDSPAVHACCARLQLDRLGYAEAERHLRFALSRAPGAALLHALVGEALRGQGRPTEAAEACLAALALNPLCTSAEQQLVELGPELGYVWVALPLRPAVWPQFDAAGRSSLHAAPELGWSVRGAWRDWATAVLRLWRELPPDCAPLAGLPREPAFLTQIHRELLRGWRRRRRCGSRRGLEARLLDWLAAVDADGLLPAYLHYSYLPPAMAADFRAWREREPESLPRLYRDHMMRRDGLDWPTPPAGPAEGPR